MSGHSKWSQIKHQKAATDAKKGKIFSKFARSISMAAKEGGDPNLNYKLRLIIDRAKAAGMPNDNIDRAIRRGTGEEKGGELTLALYEGLGPAASAFIVEAATDNTNRTLQEVKLAFTKNNGQMADNGSVAWMFEQRGIITVKNADKENLTLTAIDAGAVDVIPDNENLEIHTEPKELMKTKNILEENGADVENAELAWIPKQNLNADEKEMPKIEKLYEALDDLDDVVNVYTNIS